MAYDASTFESGAANCTTPEERMEFLRDFLDGIKPNDPHTRFDMGVWYDTKGGLECDTVACIGGWACCLFLPNRNLRDVSITEAGALIGLSYSDASALFYPATVYYIDGRSRRPYDITPQQAVKVLDRYLAIGEIEWGAAWED